MLRFPLGLFLCRSPEGEGAGGGAGAGSGDAAAKAAAEAERAELAALRQEKIDRAAADRKRDEDAAKARGEHEQLATKYKTELDEVKGKLTEHEKREGERIKRIDARNAERVKAIPEGFRSLIPTSLKGEELADYLDTNAKLLGGTEMAAGTLGGGKKPDDDKIPPECTAEAEKYGVPPATWHKTVWKPREAAAKKAAGGAAS
jgi:hypothetical protein